jgi:hypothetical protein
LQDLKSENGNIRSLLNAIIEHLGINAGKKRKGQDDTTKQGKTHAALATSKGGIGKQKKSTQKPGAVSLPKRYVTRENSSGSGSESSGNESPSHHALFARVQLDPMPKLSVQRIFGPNSRPALDNISEPGCSKFRRI